ncbi:HAD family hydrolase [Halovenus rubra]|uniref:HAD family hydrolase n=2 Tax=Halovenus rubra TaxID=869890 RepID=A0ABD5X109_9EURY|nr:HAD family hydrolase [Halovenus rubra]
MSHSEEKILAAVEAVVFDIDGTLCEYERSTATLLPLAFDRAGVEPFFSSQEYVERYETFLEDSDDVDDHREACFTDIAQEKGRDPETARAVARAYAAERDHTRIGWLDGAQELLDNLTGEYRLAAVTNGGPGMQSQKLETLGIDCFETVVHAGYDTAAKPDPEPFETALSAVNTDPEQAIYVGNSLQADVVGAHNAGISAAWIANGETTDPTPTPEYVLESPGDLLDMLCVSSQ